VAITDEAIGISQLLGGPGCPPKSAPMAAATMSQMNHKKLYIDNKNSGIIG